MSLAVADTVPDPVLEREPQFPHRWTKATAALARAAANRPSPIKQAVELQDLVRAKARDKSTTGSGVAACARVWAELEALKRAIKGKPLPRSAELRPGDRQAPARTKAKRVAHAKAAAGLEPNGRELVVGGRITRPLEPDPVQGPGLGSGSGSGPALEQGTEQGQQQVQA